MKGPWRITFDTNPDLCNVNCIMCEVHSPFRKLHPDQILPNPSKKIMPINIVQRVISEAKEYGLQEVIPSTMGEPLLYPFIDEFIEIINRHKIKLNLTTNGMFPRHSIEDWARKLLPILSDIKISMNGITKELAESIMTNLNFEKQQLNIDILLQMRQDPEVTKGNKPRITMQVTFMKKNLQQIPKMVMYAIQKGMDRVKGHHLWITWPEIQSESLRSSADLVKQWNETVDEVKKIAESIKKPDGTKIILENFSHLSFNETNENANLPNEYKCPFLGKEAWISWDGKFNVCCAPDEKRASLGNFGNVQEKSLMILWQSSGYQNLIENYEQFQVCKECNMRKLITNNYGE